MLTKFLSGGSIIGIKEEWKKERWAGLSLRWATNLSHRLGWLGLCIHVCSWECLVGLGKQVKKKLKLPPDSKKKG
jgi:hypothetical protein